MQKFQGAVIKEQGVTFAVVVVKKSVLDFPQQRQSAIDNFSMVFPGLPIVLMAQDVSGRPTYWGRKDLAQFLSRVPLQAIPWEEYTLNA